MKKFKAKQQQQYKKTEDATTVDLRAQLHLEEDSVDEDSGCDDGEVKGYV